MIRSTYFLQTEQFNDVTTLDSFLVFITSQSSALYLAKEVDFHFPAVRVSNVLVDVVRTLSFFCCSFIDDELFGFRLSFGLTFERAPKNAPISICLFFFEA